MENKKEYTINVSRETLEGVVMIDRKKMTTLLINVISVKMFLTFPKVMIINSGNAAWIECIYNTLIVIGLFWITTKLYRSNKNIIQLAEMTGKKWLKIICSFIDKLFVNYKNFPRNSKNCTLAGLQNRIYNTDIYACYRNRCIYRS